MLIGYELLRSDSDQRVEKNQGVLKPTHLMDGTRSSTDRRPLDFNSFDINHRKQISQDAVSQLQKAGCSKIFLDFPSGNHTELNAAMNSLSCGDILVVIRFNSLGTDRLSFLKNLNILRIKGVHLQSLSENFLLPSNPLETEDFIKSCFSPQQHQPIQYVENQPSSNKKKIGRPSLPMEKIELIRLLQANNPRMTITEICNLASISRPTYHKYFPKSQN